MDVNEFLGCRSKHRFPNKEQAKERANQLGMYYYGCQRCGGYHLTNQVTYESIMDE